MAMIESIAKLVPHPLPLPKNGEGIWSAVDD
jgi:hypothetical protein